MRCLWDKCLLTGVSFLFTKRRQNPFKIGTRDKFIWGRKICFTLFQMISYLHDFFNERWFSHTILCIHKAVAYTTYLELGNWRLEYKMAAWLHRPTQHDTEKRRESFLIWPIFDRNFTFKWVLVSIFHLILCFFSWFETIRVDPSWSDPDWRSKLIRSDFCTCLFEWAIKRRMRPVDFLVNFVVNM